jgi:hypothetical protein
LVQSRRTRRGTKLGAYLLGFDYHLGKTGSTVSIIAHDGHNTTRSANDATCEPFESGRRAPLDHLDVYCIDGKVLGARQSRDSDGRSPTTSGSKQ